MGIQCGKMALDSPLVKIRKIREEAISRKSDDGYTLKDIENSQIDEQ